MAFWDDIQKGVTGAASFTAKKTTEFTGIAKIKYSIHVCEQKLDKCFAEIGRLHYDTQKEGTDHSREIETIIMQIEKLTNDLAFKNAELMKMRKSVTCTACGAEVAKECHFCPVCGKRMDDKSDVE